MICNHHLANETADDVARLAPFDETKPVGAPIDCAEGAAGICMHGVAISKNTDTARDKMRSCSLCGDLVCIAYLKPL